MVAGAYTDIVRGMPPGLPAVAGATVVLQHLTATGALTPELRTAFLDHFLRCGVVWCAVVCCGVLWCVVVCCGVLWRRVVCVWGKPCCFQKHML